MAMWQILICPSCGHCCNFWLELTAHHEQAHPEDTYLKLPPGGVAVVYNQHDDGFYLYNFTRFEVIAFLKYVCMSWLKWWYMCFLAAVRIYTFTCIYVYIYIYMYVDQLVGWEDVHIALWPGLRSTVFEWETVHFDVHEEKLYVKQADFVIDLVLP